MDKLRLKGTDSGKKDLKKKRNKNLRKEGKKKNITEQEEEKIYCEQLQIEENEKSYCKWSAEWLSHEKKKRQIHFICTCMLLLSCIN